MNEQHKNVKIKNYTDESEGLIAEAIANKTSYSSLFSYLYSNIHKL